MKNWYSIQNKASGGAANISIHDEIGLWGVSAKQFIDEVQSLGDVSEITLSIHSPGGDVLDGVAIYNALASHPATITARVDGFAGSMASVILMAADHIEMPENAFLMIHNPWSGVIGDAQEMRDTAETLEKIQGQILTAYEKRTGQSREEIQGLMDHTTYLSAAEALEMGFADEITKAFKAAALERSWKAKMPQNFPEGLVFGTTKPEIESNPEPQKPTQSKSEQPPIMSGPATTEKPEAPAVIDTKEIQAQERTRIAQINAIGQRFKVEDKEINNAIDKEISVDAFRKTVMDSFDPQALNVTAPDSSGVSTYVGDSAASEYSVCKALTEWHANGTLTGLEAEVQQEMVAKHIEATGNSPSGVMLPGEVTHGPQGGASGSFRAAQTAGTDTAGGHTVPTETRSIIEYLEDYMLLPDLGATFLRDLTGNVEFPRNSSSYTIADDAETDAISYSDAVFGVLALSPKRCGGGTKVSKQLMRQSSADIEQWVRRRIGRDIAKKMDRNAIIGAGGDAPTGVLSASGTTAYTFQVGSSAHVNTVSMWGDLRGNNAASASACWLSDPTVSEDWMTTERDSSGNRFIIEGTPKEGQSVLGYSYKDHTDVTAGKVVFGDFSYLIAAMWGGIDLVVDEYSSKDQGLLEIFVNAYADVGLEQPSAFVIGDDGTTHA